MEKGINGELYTQAANSPDTNLLEMRFFRTIQSFNDAGPKPKEELIQVVSAAYENYPRNKINHTWFTLQCCFNHIMKNYSGNNYKIDCISKERLECIDSYWMSWRWWWRHNNSLTQAKAQMKTWKMKTQNKQKLGKHKRIPILPTQKWEDGGYGQ